MCLFSITSPHHKDPFCASDGWLYQSLMKYFKIQVLKSLDVVIFNYITNDALNTFLSLDLRSIPLFYPKNSSDAINNNVLMSR